MQNEVLSIRLLDEAVEAASEESSHHGNPIEWWHY